MSSHKKTPKYYRLAQRPYSQCQRPTQQSLEKLTQNIIRKKHYVYIDINEENGICEMERIKKPEQSERDLVIGENNYVCSINQLPPQSQKAIDYIYKIRELRQKKQKYNLLLKQHLKAAQAQNKAKNKQNKLRNFRLKSQNLLGNYSTPVKKQSNNDQQVNAKNLTFTTESTTLRTTKNTSVILYRETESKHYVQTMQKKELEKANRKILKKETALIEKYGMTNKFQSITKQRSQIIRKHKKVLLPQIRSAPNFYFQ